MVINEVMTLIDKYDKIGEDKFRMSLNELVGSEKSDFINKVMNINGDEYNKGIAELQQVMDMLAILGVEEQEYIINLKIIRGLDYYTGTVFETFLIENESYGSICSGGRYDNLAENYTENVLPGVGISIGLTRLFFILKEIGFIDNYEFKSSEDFIIIPIGNTMEYCGEIYRKLQDSGRSVEIYLEDDKLKKKLNYANKLGISKVMIIGEEEVSKREVKVKDMITGLEEIFVYDKI